MDLPFFTIACVGVGALAGFLGGLLGIGGGVIIVPALIILLDMGGLTGDAHLTTLVAVGTSLASIIFTSASAARAQIRARMVEWQVVKRWAGPLVVGSFLAGFVAAALPVEVLRALIGTFLLFVSVVMLTSWKPSPHRSLPGVGPSVAIAGTAGLISGIAGIGGGNVVVPTLVFCNTPVHRATATSSTLGLPIALAGSLGYVVRGFSETAITEGFVGFVYLPAFAAIVAATVLAAPLGVRVAHAMSPTPLRKAFGLLLVAVAIRMIWSTGLFDKM